MPRPLVPMHGVPAVSPTDIGAGVHQARLGGMEDDAVDEAVRDDADAVKGVGPANNPSVVRRRM